MATDIQIKQDNETQLTKDISAEVISITEKLEYEIMRCVSCPIILECKKTKPKLDILREEVGEQADKVYSEELELDNSAENTIRAQQKRAWIIKELLKERAPGIFANDRCDFEKQEVMKLLQKFVNAGYNITDPRTSLILNELVGNILNSGRANKAFTSLGIILKKDTPAGPIYYSNPLVNTKLQFSRLIMEATETLDRILKSDTEQKKANTFTEHLIQQLKIREQRKQEQLSELLGSK